MLTVRTPIPPWGDFCHARHDNAPRGTWSGQHPRCFLRAGHLGPHETSTGQTWEDQ
jgi:hypothetical protein